MSVHPVLPEQNVALVDVVDRLIDGGVVVNGDVLLSLAEVDLVYVGLRLVLTPAQRVQQRVPHGLGIAPAPRPQETGRDPAPLSSAGTRPTGGSSAPPLPLDFPEPDREDVGRGLAQLVLTIVELLRQLMERQSLRRVEEGGLRDDQIERLGQTLMLLEDRMAELREHFGLEEEDLNLDLGPLGRLL